MDSTPTVAVLLGAGFAAPFEVPVMRPFYEGFIAQAHSRYPGLSAALDEIMRKAGPQADLEALLDALNKAAAAVDGLPPAAVTDEIRTWSQNAIRLRSHLLSYIVEVCEQFDRDSATLLASDFICAIGRLGAEIFTTNYDRVVEHVCEACGLVVSDGFRSREMDLVAEWTAEFSPAPTLTKLHGSVTWYVDRESIPERVLRLDRGYPLPGPEFRLSRAGSALEPLMIVPTLEKDTTQPPYNHLMTRLGVVLQRCDLLLAIGTSLRDSHLIGAIAYSADSLAMLVVDRDARNIVGKLQGIDAMPLECEIERFLEFSVPRLSLAIEASRGLETSARRDIIRKFASEEQHHLELAGTLGQRESDLLKEIQSDDPVRVLPALEALRGVKHPEIMNAIRGLRDHARPDVRSAVCGALGFTGLGDDIDLLFHIACEDQADIVRLEASLAIARIGGTPAEKALENRAAAKPDDTFIATALENLADSTWAESKTSNFDGGVS